MAIKSCSARAAWFAVFLAAGCGHPTPKQVQTPPPPAALQLRPARNLVVLLPAQDGKASALSITNAAGSQRLTEPYQAVRIEQAGSAPGAPFIMQQAEVRTEFGAVLDALPAPEASFLLYFGAASDTLTPQSQTELANILMTIRDRHSTAITVIGHTDTTGSAPANFQLGLRRAHAIAATIIRRGAAAADVFVESHGDADLLVKTGPGVAESRNRRVEVIVR